MERNVLSNLKVDYIKTLLKEGRREDGRAFDQWRDLDIEINYVPRASGSAFVRLGKTKVIAGVKVQVETPYGDTAGRGNFMTGADLSPMASPNFEAGPPSPDAIEVARVTDRAMRESGVMDLEALCIEHGSKVWAVYCDLDIIDYDGNLFDACSIAALAALLSAQLPAVCPKTKIEVYPEARPMPLRMQNATFSTTFVKIGNDILVDPGLYEELVADTRVTIGVDPTGASRSMQKGGKGSWTVAEIKELRARATGYHAEIMKYVNHALAGKKYTPKPRVVAPVAKPVLAAKPVQAPVHPQKGGRQQDLRPQAQAAQPRAAQPAPAAKVASVEELAAHSVADLKAKLVAAEIKAPSKAKKAELVDLLHAHLVAAAKAAQPKQEAKPQRQQNRGPQNQSKPAPEAEAADEEGQDRGEKKRRRRRPRRGGRKPSE